MINRRVTKNIFVGKVGIGNDYPISIQSMTNTKTEDVVSTLHQINDLYKAGCEIIRLSIPNKESAQSLNEIIKQSPIPVIADIHFDTDLAFDSILAGVHCLRINPGTFASTTKLENLILECKKTGTPMRIGINSGSLQKDILKRYGHPTSEALCESTLQYINIFENHNFYDFKISIKSSSVTDTVAAYRLLSNKTKYPFHVGLTESGTLKTGTIKSSIAIGSLLLDGIGDTIRVSLADNPIREIEVAKSILSSLEIRKFGANIIACPTCARCGWDVFEVAKAVEEKFSDEKYSGLKIAVMGCPVNGPGEAREADFGLAGGNVEADGSSTVMVFNKGNIIKKVAKADALSELISLVENRK